MSVAEMCALAQLSRAGYYRFLTTPAAGNKDTDLRDAIQRITLEFPTYGRPRIIANPRRKIEPDPAQPRYLVNVRGLGYRFEGGK